MEHDLIAREASRVKMGDKLCSLGIAERAEDKDAREGRVRPPRRPPRGRYFRASGNHPNESEIHRYMERPIARRY